MASSLLRAWIGFAFVGAVAGCSGQPAVPDSNGASNAPEPAPPLDVAVEPAEPEPAAEPPLPPLPAGPVITEAAEAAHAQAQARLLRSDERLPPLPPVPPALARARAVALGLAIAPEEGEPDSVVTPEEGEPPPDAATVDMPGYFVPIVDPNGGPALEHFHRALVELAEGRDEDGKVRVAMYGASGTAADLAVGYVRTYLQTRFGDGGPGFIPLVPLSRWYRHSEVKVEASKGWRKEHAQRRDGRLDGHYGLLGASFAATKAKRWCTVSPKKRSTSCEGVSEIELLYLRQPDGGSFRAQIDDGPKVEINTAADEVSPGYHAFSVEPGAHTIRVETSDDTEVRVFGVILERPDPGVVVDVLGIDGTRGSNHLTWNEALWADNIQRRAPDLYTLSYGTNESVDEDLSVTLYAEDFREHLRRFSRVLPEASCVVIAPVDFPLREGDALSVRPLLKGIIAAQRQISAEEGCGFWDGVAFMGGELSMATWVNSEPPLARGDHLHFTLRGATRKGMALSDALLHAFDARGLGATP